MRWRCVRPPPLPAPRLATAGGSARWNFAPGTVLTLEVRFLDRPFSAYSAAALSAANSWPGAVRFAETGGPGVIRVSSDPAGGGWAQTGSDAARVPFPLPTMNLALDAGHPDFAGHAAHEFGHARGYDHTHRQESIRGGLIRPRVEADYAAEFGWSADDVYDAIFRPLSADELAPPADWHSVLSYPFTAAQRVAGVATGGGAAVSAIDAAFDLATYPMPIPPVPPGANVFYAYHEFGSAPGFYAIDPATGGYTPLGFTVPPGAGPPIPGRFEIRADGSAFGVFQRIGGTWLKKAGQTVWASVNAPADWVGAAG